MNGKIPHIVQYQGSKRILASQILQYMPQRFNRLIEPFAGMAAISIATAYEKRTDSFLINDVNKPLVGLLESAVENPKQLVEDYSAVWNEQFSYGEDHVRHFYDVRERFNNGDEKPANMLYLLARCVKGSVRYGKTGNFNQSPDKRRHGTNPKTLEQNVYAIAYLLKGKTRFFALDYHEILDMARPGDVVYMDPPYQGVTNVRDNRYFAGVPFDEFVKAVETLNRKGVDYLISYDGACGEKEYGEELPQSLHCKKVMLNAGVSSQSLLLGKKSITFEALYVSEALIPVYTMLPRQLSFLEALA
ncbi:MAG: Dam family site-specific DNA-(adenine-N6)-methyltransferase [Treponemataceae bacterium]|nr:Dam family site-specific DNA-(adenine-N6)-methyltransferase [Treponemataceae bacterium]